jgi:hypothetical protein
MLETPVLRGKYRLYACIACINGLTPRMKVPGRGWFTRPTRIFTLSGQDFQQPAVPGRFFSVFAQALRRKKIILHYLQALACCPATGMNQAGIRQTIRYLPFIPASLINESTQQITCCQRHIYNGDSRDGK